MTPRAALRLAPFGPPFVAALVVCGCAPRAQGPQAGAPFPPTRFEALGPGEALVLPAPGQAMVVNFWATWCEPCRREMASLERLHRAAPSGVRVVGVSVDADRFLAQEFARHLGLTFPNGRADADVVGRVPLGVRAYPTTFVVDAAGVVRWREEGPRDWSSAETAARLAAALAAR